MSSLGAGTFLGNRKIRPFSILAWGGAIWPVIGTTLLLFQSASDPTRLQQWEKVAWPLVSWLLWSVLAIPIFAIAARYPFTPSTWRVRLPLHAVLSVVAATLYIALYVTMRWFFATPFTEDVTTLSGMFVQRLPRAFIFGPLIYWTILSMFHLPYCHAMARTKRLQVTEAEEELARANLEILHQRAQPQLLLPVLQEIEQTLGRDAATAEEMILRLSDFLRLTLQTFDEENILTEDQLELARAYLRLQSLRRPLRFGIDADHAVLGRTFPRFLLLELLQKVVASADEQEEIFVSIVVQLRGDSVVTRYRCHPTPDLSALSQMIDVSPRHHASKALLAITPDGLEITTPADLSAALPHTRSENVPA